MIRFRLVFDTGSLTARGHQIEEESAPDWIRTPDALKVFRLG